MGNVTSTRSLTLIYVKQRRARGELSASTYRLDMGILFRFADDVPENPRSVNRRHIEKWMERPDLAATTRRIRLSVVRGFCRWCVERRDMRSDPTAGIKSPPAPRSLPRALRHEHVARLLAACPGTREELIVLLAVQEGLRRGEIARAQLGDVDFNEHALFVRGKGGHERVLPVTDETWSALTRYLGEYPAHAGPLVRSYTRPKSGLSPLSVGALVVKIMRDAGLKTAAHDGFSLHPLRHTAATDMLRAGAHVRDVQRALGHANLKTTEVYLPWLVGDLREAMNGRTYGR